MTSDKTKATAIGIAVAIFLTCFAATLAVVLTDMTLKQVALIALQAVLEWFKIALIGFSFGVGFLSAVKVFVGSGIGGVK